MLEFIRQNVVGAVGFVIVGALVFVFAVGFGSQSQGWCKGEALQYVASVEGRDISEGVFEYAAKLSGAAPGKQGDVLEGLVERELLIALAEDAGITASTGEAEDRIIGNEYYLSSSLDALGKQFGAFYPPTAMAQALIKNGHRARVPRFENDKGQFEYETYANFVKFGLNVTEQFFVEQQRLEIIAERMRELLVSAVNVSDAEVRDSYYRDADTAVIEYVKFSPSYFSDQLSPAAEELNAWAGTHSDEIKQYYEANKFQYTNLEKKVRARHILIKVADGSEETVKAAARAKIEGLLALAKGGADFAALARENSEDPGSARKGGDLGYTPRGRMVPKFDDAMFSLEPAQLSDVVETKYGFHIIRVEDIREGDVTLEAATQEIAEILYRRNEGKVAAEKRAGAVLARLKAGEEMAAIFPEEEGETPNFMAPKPRKSREFTRGVKTVPGVGEAPEVVTAVFELSMDSSLAGQVFNVSEDFYVVKLAERNLPDDAEFARKEDELRETMLAVKRASVLRQRVGEFKAQAQSKGRLKRLLTVAPPADALPQIPGGMGGPAPAQPIKAEPAPTPSDAPAGKAEES